MWCESCDHVHGEIVGVDKLLSVSVLTMPGLLSSYSSMYGSGLWFPLL